MQNLFSQFQISDWLEFYGIIASFIVSVVSVLVAVLALRQNNKMLEETTRPYVAISYDVVFNGTRSIFLMLKNYGSSGAKITSFDFKPLSNSSHINEQLAKINGAFLAPHQKIMYNIDPTKFPDNTLDFTITYKNGSKTYTENQSLKIKIGIFKERSNEECAVSYSLQEITERLI